MCLSAAVLCCGPPLSRSLSLSLALSISYNLTLFQLHLANPCFPLYYGELCIDLPKLPDWTLVVLKKEIFLKNQLSISYDVVENLTALETV